MTITAMAGPAEELDIYDRRGDAWWDDRDPAFASLRSVNRFRLATLRRWLGDSLRDADVVDLGCGGGLLAAPLARGGARVTGVDRSATSLACARANAPSSCRFIAGDLRRTGLPDRCADLVLLADVLEHLTDPGAAVAEAARLLRPGGALYVNTINATHRARWLAISVAERIGLIPRGTHDHRLFIAPDRLDELAARAGLSRHRREGEGVALWRTLRDRAVTLRPSRSLAVAYCALYRKDTP